jgi:hypothetical protein
MYEFDKRASGSDPGLPSNERTPHGTAALVKARAMHKRRLVSVSPLRYIA